MKESIIHLRKGCILSPTQQTTEKKHQNICFDRSKEMNNDFLFFFKKKFKITKTNDHILAEITILCVFVWQQKNGCLFGSANKQKKQQHTKKKKNNKFEFVL